MNGVTLGPTCECQYACDQEAGGRLRQVQFVEAVRGWQAMSEGYLRMCACGDDGIRVLSRESVLITAATRTTR